MTPSDLATLLAQPTSLGSDVTLEWQELRHIIDSAIRNTPRSLQTRIGPSEIGRACDRRLAYRFGGVTQQGHSASDGWKATIGTAVHAWLERTFTAANDELLARGMGTRWLCEESLTVGSLDGEDVNGSTDLCDVTTRTAIDWKITTVRKIAQVRRHGPGAQYRAQVHLYGRGWQLCGLPVERVAIAFLPRDGELAQSYLWSEPYDERVAVGALARAGAIAQVVKAAGALAIPLMDTADDYCRFCPWFRAGSTDITTACPGDAASTVGATSAAMSRDPFASEGARTCSKSRTVSRPSTSDHHPPKRARPYTSQHVTLTPTHSPWP